MKMIFLVDGDNNIGTGLQGIDLLTAEDTVLVFFGKGQTLANVKKLCAGTEAQVQYLESVKGGKNSLDFQIITELGVLVGRGEASSRMNYDTGGRPSLLYALLPSSAQS